MSALRHDKCPCERDSASWGCATALLIGSMLLTDCVHSARIKKLEQGIAAAPADAPQAEAPQEPAK